MKEEYKIGEVFDYGGGVKLCVVEGDGCDNCYFQDISCKTDAPNCLFMERRDNKSVKFIEFDKWWEN